MRGSRRSASRAERALELAARVALDCFDARRVSDCFTISIGHVGAAAACAAGAALFLFGSGWMSLG